MEQLPSLIFNAMAPMLLQPWLFDKKATQILYIIGLKTFDTLGCFLVFY